MSVELKALVDELKAGVEQFKKDNNKVVEGKASELEKQFRDNLNTAITSVEDKIESIKTAMARSTAAGNGNAEEQKHETFRKFKSALVSYANSGDDRELKGLSVGSGNDGGDTVPRVIQNVIDRIVTENSPIRQVANIANVGNNEYRKLVSQAGAAVGWVSETGTRSATNTPTTRTVTIAPHELYAYPASTLQALEDSQFDLENWLQTEVADAYVIAEGDAFINGDGSNKPKGFLNSSVYTRGSAWGNVQALQAQSASGLNGMPSADDVIKLSEALKTQYSKNGKFLGNRAMRQHLRTLKATDGHYYYESATSGAPAMFNGHEFVECPDIEAIVASPLSGDALVFGDFKRFYTIVDRIGMSVVRDNITSPGSVKFYFRKRVGGGIIDSNAAVVLTVG